MSNAEMPPLQTGQVWDYGSDRATLGQYLAKEDEFSVRWRELGSRWEYASFLRNHLRVQRARLIHGPGAPWSPAEDVPHA